MKSPEDIDHLTGTKIDSASIQLIARLREADIDVESPLVTYLENDEPDMPETNDDHSESFMEFANRRLLYGGDDHRRKYDKGEIYYESGIEKALVDSLGATLTDIGLFTNEKEVTVKLVKVDQLYQVKVVTIYESAKDISVEEEESWVFITAILAGRTFDGNRSASLRYRIECASRNSIWMKKESPPP